MTPRSPSFPLVSLVLVLLVGPGLDGRAAELGDPAPALKVSKWIKGEPVDLEKGKGSNVYVVEFWATWCPPCRTSIPHLTEIAKKHRDKGLVIVGVTNETDADKVGEFVKGMGEKMDYVVAQDDGRETFSRYMEAFGQNGIPHAFIVDKAGKLAWHGHPMAGMDAVVEGVLAGTFSLADAKAADEKAKQAMQSATRVREYFLQLQKTQQMGEKLLKDIEGNSALLNELAWTLLTGQWIRGRDLDLAFRAAKAAYDACEGKDAAIVDTYARALFDTGRKEEALELQKKAISLATQEELKKQLQETLEGYQKAMGAPAETAKPAEKPAAAPEEKPKKTIRL